MLTCIYILVRACKAGTICRPLHEVIFVAVTKLHYTWNDSNHQIQLVGILKECMHNQNILESLNLCYQKKYLQCLHQQQDGETALTFACKKEDPRSVELLLKASADPNHMTMVNTAGKEFPSFLNF